MKTKAASKKSTLVEVRKEANKQALELQNELISELLRRANLTKKDIINPALKSWALQNLDLFSPSELKKYKQILL